MSGAYRAVVYGATPAGVAAAVRCAREGLDVTLVEPGGHLGGMIAAGIGIFDTNHRGSRCPLFDEIRGGILAHYEETYGCASKDFQLARDNLTFEPHVGEAVVESLVRAEPRIRVLMRRRLAGAVRSGRRLLSIRLEADDGAADERIDGDAFVDASYEGDLAAAAGAPYRIGREARREYGEPHAGRLFTRKVDRSAEDQKFPFEAAQGRLRLRPFDSCSERLFAGSTGEGDHAIMAYNFRIFLSRDPLNQAPIPPPRHYDRSRYAGMLQSESENWRKPCPIRSRWLLGGLTGSHFGNHREIPNRKICWNHGDYPGANHGYPEAGPAERAAILDAHLDHELGLLWFLRHDPEVPRDVREQAQALGLARDEFADSGHLPWNFYVREARRIEGRYVFTEGDACVAPGIGRTPPHCDSIGVAEWMMDSHDCRVERQPGSAGDGCFMLSEATRPSQIPYRCLLPRGLDNLLVPVCLSSSHVGWGTLRVEPVWIQMGEAAGFALAQASRDGVPPAAVGVPALQRRLADHGFLLGFFNDGAAGTPMAAALQYFAGRGFFSDYWARPHDPLDAGTARTWIESFCDDALGQLDPLARARELRVPSPDRIGMHQFEVLLQSRWRHRTAGQPLRLPPDRPREDLARGAACLLLYSALALRNGSP